MTEAYNDTYGTVVLRRFAGFGTYKIMTERISQAQRVVNRFGSVTAIASAYNRLLPADDPISEATIRGWLRAGIVHEKHWLKLMIAARIVGVELTAYDFVAHVAEAFAEHLATERASTSGESSTSSALQPA